MAFNIDKELKIYWICGIIVTLFYAVISLTITGFLNVGGFQLATAIIAIWLYKDIDTWEKIEDWVLFGIIRNLLTFMVFIIWIIAFNAPIEIIILSALIVTILFAIVGIQIWIQKRK